MRKNRQAHTHTLVTTTSSSRHGQYLAHNRDREREVNTQLRANEARRFRCQIYFSPSAHHCTGCRTDVPVVKHNQSNIYSVHDA